MIAKLGKVLNRLSDRFVPDPFVLVLVLTVLTVVGGFFFGAEVRALSPLDRAATLSEGWFGQFYNTGLMKFAMQMAIVLLTGHALAMSTPVRRLIKALARVVTSPGGAVIVVALVACLASLIQWGLGAIAGAFMAREMGRAFAEEGRSIHYPLLGAAGYAGFLVWHGGLSGTAPLAVAQDDHFLVETLGVIPVSETLFSNLNLIVTAALLIVIPLLFWRLMPRDIADMRGFEEWEPRGMSAGIQAPRPSPSAHPLIRLLEGTRLLNLIAGLTMTAVLIHYFADRGLDGWNLDSINLLFLTLGVLLHPTPRSYAAAIADGARGAAGIILQFPFYFGILGLLIASGLIIQISNFFLEISTVTTYPLFTFLSAGIVNFFVPSGGGQWAVQGPVMMEAIDALGVAPHKAIMALSYGDAWTNMLQPFWALPLLGITGLRARDIIGYTGFVFLVTGPIFIGLLLVF
ncbi:MAG: short-chain fatty acid transporter [Bradymonadaceae bacterium]